MWTIENIPNQSDKTAIVTGANAGIGYQTALALYEKGADVIIAARDEDKMKMAVEKISKISGNGSISYMVLDLGNLKSVSDFASDFKSKYKKLDLLINNAGVMVPPAGKTVDGFELQFGINFIGHFALTCYLYPLLKDTKDSRVVTLSSGAHKLTDTIDFENVRLEKPYDARSSYAMSKLADITFAIELQRRINTKGDHIISVSSHPGVTRTDLQRHLDNLEERFAAYPAVMEAPQGALSTLYAATSPDITGGEYYGPDGEGEFSGFPAKASIGENAKDPNLGEKLWRFAENSTNLFFP
ncbi:oxidoreductase [Epilithonimonas lactis]|jgi:NAD(P)-dependent dehydrogenase (short-subunit alcohol dehydrogenase family)|uniref:Short-chain dehydrogenase n=1 Tax=Epilithonimonas lactis TaxID=421072 RepID=A0A085BLA6_9FLAO|nr:oxidoreductase [Epilithonimonas lactis]KFC23251.1 short-chain dehydrogenase [Epilithonimonas lactis]SEQ06748.1 NAD(P)-dependent dehydrogenase, short-chain alcohol dehydrogenase family [Epilithonimonas lactis]